jgi:class 3 adenylate cyclase
VSGCDGHGCSPRAISEFTTNAGITIASRSSRRLYHALRCGWGLQDGVNTASINAQRSQTSGTQAVYEFGSFRIDIALSRLERAGEPVPLPPKAFDLLLLLARNSDHVMTKAELMETLWPNTFVDEANLTQHVYTLRKALGTCRTGSRSSIQCLAAAIVLPRRFEKSSIQLPHALRPRTLSGRPSDPPATVAASALAPEGERKERASVLDCRIANAAAVVERLGSVAAQDLTRDLLKMATGELGRYGGVMTERRADGFVALFGAPVVHEDDGRRAVLAALAIQERFGRLAAPELNHDEPLSLRIGISTGGLVVTRSGSHAAVEYAAVGDAARVADLLQQLASPGMMLISDTTRRAVEGYIETSRRLRVTERPEPVFRVVGLLCRPTAQSARLARTLAPFVGRHHELAVLGDLVSGVCAGKGQAGHHRRRSGNREIASAARVHAARGRAGGHGGARRTVRLYGSNIPFLPLADFLRTLCGVRESDPPETMGWQSSVPPAITICRPSPQSGYSA